MLGTIKCVDKCVNDNSARRLDNCDVIASRSAFGVRTGVLHSEVELQIEFKSFTAVRLGSNTNQHMDWTLEGTYIKSSSSVYATHLEQSVRLLLLKYRGGDNAHWIFQNKTAATAVQWELCGTNFRENIANLWVSFYNGTGAGRMITSKPSLRSGFDCIIRPAPSGAGRTPSQPGHYPLSIYISNYVNNIIRPMWFSTKQDAYSTVNICIYIRRKKWFYFSQYSYKIVEACMAKCQ